MLAYKFNSLPIDIKLDYNDSFSHTGYNVERLAGSEKYLTNCMWVVCFTEENGASSNDTFVQGSAFMISGQRVITCNHTFKAASDLQECTIYQAHNQKVKYKMRKKEFCEHRDYVELEFIDEPKVKFSTFRVFKEHKLIAGYKLTLVGFPEYDDNQKIANIVDAKVVSTQYMSKVYRYEVDVEISAGFSGGAVVNRYGQLVGMVTHGKTVTYADDDKNKPIIEGKSLFLGSENFL